MEYWHNGNTRPPAWAVAIALMRNYKSTNWGLTVLAHPFSLFSLSTASFSSLSLSLFLSLSLPPSLVYNQFKQTEKEKALFSLKGSMNAEKRMAIYTFLLSHMADEHRFQLTAKLCQVRGRYFR